MKPYWLLWVLRLEIEQLCYNNAARSIIYRSIDTHYALFQEPGIDVVCTLPSAGCLYDIRDVVEVPLAL